MLLTIRELYTYLKKEKDCLDPQNDLQLLMKIIPLYTLRIDTNLTFCQISEITEAKLSTELLPI